MSLPFFVVCASRRFCEAIREVPDAQTQARLVGVWRCAGCRAKQRPVRKAKQPAPPSTDQPVRRFTVVGVVDAYTRGRDEGWRAGFQACDAAHARGDR